MSSESSLSLNNLERLILAQAVYELGSDAWSNVSTILSRHPLVSKHDNATFSPSASLTPFFISSYHSTPLSSYRLAEPSMTTLSKYLDSAGHLLCS
jgi:hypothetical protein